MCFHLVRIYIYFFLPWNFSLAWWAAWWACAPHINGMTWSPWLSQSCSPCRNEAHFNLPLTHFRWDSDIIQPKTGISVSTEKKRSFYWLIDWLLQIQRRVVDWCAVVRHYRSDLPLSFWNISWHCGHVPIKHSARWPGRNKRSTVSTVLRYPKVLNLMANHSQYKLGVLISADFIDCFQCFGVSLVNAAACRGWSSPKNNTLSIHLFSKHKHVNRSES